MKKKVYTFSVIVSVEGRDFIKAQARLQRRLEIAGNKQAHFGLPRYVGGHNKG